jgi:hypothetical protein
MTRCFCYRITVCAAAFLSAPAIAQVPTNGLVGYWRGDHNALDSSPTGNNGSFGGTYTPGLPGSDFAFDLATDRVVVPDNPAYDFQNYSGWTVGFWFNTNGTPLTDSGFAFLGQDEGSGYHPKWFIDYGYTVFHPTNTFVLHVNDYNQERIFVESKPLPLPTGWNQLTITTDNATGVVYFYLNGQSIGVGGMPGYVLRPEASLVFGVAETGFGYQGLMNDVVIYNRTISEQEVRQLVLAPPYACPVIAAQPVSRAICPSGDASFSVAATGSVTVGVTWQLEDVAVLGGWRTISDGPLPGPSGTMNYMVSGAQTPTVTFTAGAACCDGPRTIRVRARISNFCGAISSNAASLYFAPGDVGQQGGVPGHDGLYNNNDFLVFIDRFFSQDPVADIGIQGGLLGSDGMLDNNDFVVFIDQFFAGC